jgi:hypothetical protein
MHEIIKCEKGMVFMRINLYSRKSGLSAEAIKRLGRPYRTLLDDSQEEQPPASTDMEANQGDYSWKPVF